MTFSTGQIEENWLPPVITLDGWAGTARSTAPRHIEASTELSKEEHRDELAASSRERWHLRHLLPLLICPCTEKGRRHQSGTKTHQRS
jgi:hypothetical protein